MNIFSDEIKRKGSPRAYTGQLYGFVETDYGCYLIMKNPLDKSLYAYPHAMYVGSSNIGQYYYLATSKEKSTGLDEIAFIENAHGEDDEMLEEEFFKELV